MALIRIPSVIEVFHENEKSILQKLRMIYSKTEYTSYIYYDQRVKNLTPDFILIDPQRGIAVIEVKAWSIGYIDTIDNKSVKTTDGKEHHNPAYRCRQYYNSLNGLLSSDYRLKGGDGKFKYQLNSFLCLSNISKVDSKNISSLLEHYPAKVLYKNAIKSLELESIFPDANANRAIPDEEMQIIRSLIFPEIKLKGAIGIAERYSSPFTVIAKQIKLKGAIEIVESDNSVDEMIKALDIEQEKFIRRAPLGHYMITGVPGSGKTVMLIARAIHLLKLNPDWNIAIFTYTKSLVSNIKNRLYALNDKLSEMDVDISKFEVATFHSFALGIANIDVQDNNDFWTDILPEEALRLATPKYDAILIDEYQDFHKSWIQVCVKSLKKNQYEETVNLFLAGDRLQSIYNPKEVNWKNDIGLDMRGRSKLYKTSYRATSDHIKLGLNILKNNDKLKTEVERFYEGFENIESKNIAQNSIELIEGDYKSVVDRLISLFNNHKPEEFLVLSKAQYRYEKFFDLLPPEIQGKTFKGKDAQNDKMLITTYHSSKGLESKFAILLDIDEIDDTKLAYVALTRAQVKLIIHASDFERGRISKQIKSFVEPKE